MGQQQLFFSGELQQQPAYKLWHGILGSGSQQATHLGSLSEIAVASTMSSFGSKASAQAEVVLCWPFTSIPLSALSILACARIIYDPLLLSGSIP